MEVEYDQFLVDEDKINTALKRVLTNDYNSYVSEYGIDVLAMPQYMYMQLDTKVQNVGSGIEKRKQLNKELSTRIKMIETKGYTVSKEVENVADYLTSRSIAVTIGTDWLLKNEMDVENKKEIVNCEEKGYNRKIPINEFKRLWDVKTVYMPFYSNTFITVKGV